MPSSLTRQERDARRRLGIALLMGKKSIREVAQAVGCSERTVKRWKARPKPRPPGCRPGRPRTWDCHDLTGLSLKVDATPPDERTSERLFALLSEATKYAHPPATAAKLLRLLGLRLGRSTRAPDGSRRPGVWRREYGVALRRLENMARQKPSARPRLPLGGL
jgi:transposase